ncbi:MAG: TIM barrel protein [Acidobacteria bacterium]|nr:TIM barrel protein [Acidobacteriota bacterium]
MNRRKFIATGLASGAATIVTSNVSEAVASSAGVDPVRKFKLNYAPHFNMFPNHTGPDLVAQLQFFHAQGFTALEDNDLPNKPVADQEKIGKTLDDLKMTMGVFVATKDFQNPTFAVTTWKPEMREPILKDMRNAVEVAKRVNAKWCTVVPGCYDTKLDWEYQTASVIDMFRRSAEICEKAGLVMVMEPLNTRRDHPKLFLTKIGQAYSICRAVNSLSVKILYDMYHQQITEGNIIPNIDLAWDETVYFQIGDNPGRKEPTTGEMNYRNIFQHIYNKGYKGVMGMEHGVKDRTKEGEKAAIEAYVWCDNF